MKAVSHYVNLRRPAALVAYKATVDVVGKSVTLLVTVGAARALAPDAFGVLALGMTTGWMLGVASDAGLPLYLARAVARVEGAAQTIVRDVMRLRVQLGLAAVAIGAAIAFVLAPPGYVIAFGLIVIAHVAGAVLDTLAHVYRGLGRTDVESTITIVTRLATALLVIVVLLMQPTLLLLSVALLIPPLVALFVSFAIARRLTSGATGRRETERHEGPAFQARLGAVLRGAGPIGAGVLLSAIYFRCDVYFVSYWHGLEAVGMYNAVFRLVEALRLLPAAALAVAFPALVRAADARPLRRLALTLTAGGLLTMVATFLAAPALVQVIYGATYLPAAPALRILALALPLFFLNYALTHQVIAWDGQRAYAMITAAALVANIAGNMLLIPSQGMVGAAWSTLFTELVVMSGCVMALRENGARPLFQTS